MLGFITEADLGQADEVFPGIEQFFDSLAEKPRTFLELVWQFERWASRCARPGARPSLTDSSSERSPISSRSRAGDRGPGG